MQAEARWRPMMMIGGWRAFLFLGFAGASNDGWRERLHSQRSVWRRVHLEHMSELLSFKAERLAASERNQPKAAVAASCVPSRLDFNGSVGANDQR